MSDRDDYVPGVPCWVETLQPDPQAAAGFYGEVLGWEAVPSPVLRDGRSVYVVNRLRGRDVAGIAPLPPMVEPTPSPAWMTHVRVDRVEDAAERVVGAGGTVLFAPWDAEPAGRLGVVADPAGAPFVLWEAQDRKGAQVVNEAGAWAMSRLDTPDPAAAAAFYGAVFGWTTESFALGDDEVTMFRLPGYVGGEPEQPVSREVIATMVAAPGQPARWAVDFWVDDVDAVADTTRRQGGSVLTEPFDMPMGRAAVLADPAGASFSVTKVSVPASSAQRRPHPRGRAGAAPRRR